MDPLLEDEAPEDKDATEDERSLRDDDDDGRHPSSDRGLGLLLTEEVRFNSLDGEVLGLELDEVEEEDLGEEEGLVVEHFLDGEPPLNEEVLAGVFAS